MKIAFVGTCQLFRAAGMFAQLIDAKAIDAEIVWTKSFHELTSADAFPLFQALEAADIIYCQYQGLHFSDWSTTRLQKYFNIKIVPLLTSLVSTPQLGYWSDYAPRPDYIGYVDFRLLELYLSGASIDDAARTYQDAILDPELIELALVADIRRYRERFHKGLICFDYAPFYEQELRRNIKSFTTINHPSNTHLEWLVNEMLNNIRPGMKIALGDRRDILLNTVAPSLHGPKIDTYTMNLQPLSISLVAKMFYYYFDGIERERLETEYLKSSYYRLFREPLRAKVATVSGELAAAVASLTVAS